MAHHEVIDFRLSGWASDTEQGSVSATLWATIEKYPGWAVEIGVVLDDSGNPIVGRLLIYPRGTSSPPKFEEFGAPPQGGIPSRLLREINAGELLNMAQSRIGDAQSELNTRAQDLGDSGPVSVVWGKLADNSGSLTTAPRRAGRKGNGIEHYLAWAERYANKVAAGVRNPNAALGDEFGETTAYVRDTVTDARRRYGLLTASPGRGRAGGLLTPKALALLAQTRDEGKTT